MPKYFTYDLQSKVKVNDRAIRDMPADVDKEGVIIEHLESWQYDYLVLHDDGTLGKYKEIELNKLN